MKKLFIKTISLIMTAIIILSAFAGCDKSEANSKIMYSNLASQQVLNKLTEMMTYADISDNRQNILLEHIKQFNSIVSPDSLAAEFEEYNPEKAKYDPYDLQDEWNEKSPDFMGYNCRITAFSLFREFLDISADSEIRDEMIVLDLYALGEDSSAFIKSDDEKAFSVLYSTVPTILTKDTEIHIKSLQKDWNERGIKFIDNERASLISVVFHEAIDENDSYLFIGHTGVLFDYNDKLYFLEKLAFQEPYQLTEFENRSQLNDYLMTKYDVAFDQPTAAPFIMENDELLEGYKSITAENEKKFADAISYDMELTLDTKKNTLNEKVHIEIENKTDAPLTELCLRDMTPSALKFAEENYSSDNKDLKSQIYSITLKDSTTPLEYKFGDDKTVIYVSLGEDDKIEVGQRQTITVSMETDIPHRGDRFGFRKTEEGKIYCLSFCYPYLADNENGKWETYPYFDDGENRSYDLADYSVTLHAPESYTVAMAGVEQTENGTSTVKLESARDFAVVVCNFMKKDTFDVNGITVNSYYLDGKFTDEYRKITNAVAEDSLRIFSEEIGAYPYKELDIAPCLLGYGYGGMEYPGLVMANASGFFDNSFFDAISHEEKISHEIAHQWFYGVVGNNEYLEAWIDEGFATLLEKDVFGLADCKAHKVVAELEKDYPDLEQKEQIRTELIEYAREGYKGFYLNIPPHDFSEERFYGDAEYNGSYAFLQEVRLLIGDDAFKDMLRSYYETFYMKTVTTKEVLDFIGTYNNSKEMDEIIDFYFK